MLKILLSVIFALLTLTLSTVPSYAVSTCPGGSFSPLCKIAINDNTPVITNIITILLALSVILALFFLIFGGIRWITSGGDKGKLDQARSTITAAVVGLIITFLAFFIISIIQYLFGIGNGANEWQFPTLFQAAPPST